MATSTLSPESATLDVLRSYDNSCNSSPVASPERGRAFPDRPLDYPQLLRPDSRLSTISCDSTSNLVALEKGTRHHHKGAEPAESPFRWNLPQLPPSPEKTEHSGTQKDSQSQKPPSSIWRGWKKILLASWLNVLLLLIPVSWTLSFVMEDSHMLVFIFCVLSMIPLVKLHDLGTRELALRIGGSKAGLLNASMSNTVELVIAITALRKCELRVVQSSLIGSILSKLLLVLGMCFFAGGLRFSEQGFDQTATQIHSSLLSISVGALLLPAAYHFALSGEKDSGSTEQKKDILRMSHGVSLVLLFIYAAYLLFQLWSHTHLYKDTKTKSNRLSVKIPINTHFIKDKLTTMDTQRPMTSDSESTAISRWPTSPSWRFSSFSSKQLPTPRLPYASSPLQSSSEVTIGQDVTSDSPNMRSSDATIRLVRDAPDRSEGRQPDGFSRASSFNTAGNMSSRSTTLDSPVVLTEEPEEMTPEELELPSDESSDELAFKEPQLSWTMTLLLLTVVAVTVSVTAEELVESMDGISSAISKQWIGLILLPAVSSIAECVTAINVSVKDQLSLSVSVAVGSTIQLALFVIPFMVTLGWILDKPLALLFDPFESVVLYISVQTMSYVVADGKSNWLEGIILICLYVIIAVSFWYYPGSLLPSQLAICAATS
ncbi:Sodium/calcium exchanger protein-domain-containing protein [Hygrophoropsis aurantiaca]|uniref:Sodium/calcium exchanger protein-domain-containing protein n=1 Tax=Hygrophoropsis aurantiaca TaxID=72124 RepID=A0ACB8A7W6_9AGAM|nr:Sodium/calcium exchanger protein-domain-containing protein [Hygrophoropsis aurantiaca]